MFDAVVITCEHGGNDVPERYREWFAPHRALLESHRGYDPGTLELARKFAAAGDWPLHFSTTTRLLCDLNRTRDQTGYLSEVTATLDDMEKAVIRRDFYDPYRRAVEAEIERLIRAGRVLHLSVHSFTPVLDGEVRQADIGLLFDPNRPCEVTFCDAWRRALESRRPDLEIRRNYPYLGTSDGFTTTLRTRHPEGAYAGIELEVNQRWPLENTARWSALQGDLVTSLLAALAFH